MNTKLEDALTTGMYEHTAGVRLDVDLLTAAVRSHRRRTTIGRTVSAVGTLGLVGAVAAAAGVLPGRAGPDGLGRAPSVNQAGPQALTIAYISSRMDEALATHRNQILHLTGHLPPDVNPGLGPTAISAEVWKDLTTGNSRTLFDPTGRMDKVDIGRTLGGQAPKHIYVDHTTRTWWQGPEVARIPIGSVDAKDSVFDLTSLHQRLRSGESKLKLVGHEQVNGRDALRLVDSASQGPGSYELWVDSASFEVVRVSQTFEEFAADSRPAAPGHPLFMVSSGASLELDVAWLNRTPAALATLTVTAPAGYREVPDPIAALPASSAPAPTSSIDPSSDPAPN